MSSPKSAKPQKEGDCIRLWVNMLNCSMEGLSKNDYKLTLKCYGEKLAFSQCMEPGQDFHGEIWKTPVDTEQKLDNAVVFGDEKECGFCDLMKEGECKKTFIEWEKCVDEGKKNDENIFKKCSQVATDLKKCMLANRDYYREFLLAPASDIYEKEFLASKFGILRCGNRGNRS